MAAEPSTPELTAPFQAEPPDSPDTHVGSYKLLQQLGEGGMGVVFLAEQHEPVRRRVALKLIKLGMDSAQIVARFEAERQALAMMDHPNIARVLDAGTTDRGRPYFVMELVKGVPITKFCDDARLTVRERLELFVQVCQAVQHAHQKGIIHRDLKPSNVLVMLVDGKPVPKVIDFGVAKAIEQPLTEHTMYTQIGAVVGTWEYMSPEQAEASPLGIDTRSDVYSLGVLLYELLTGTTPLDRKKLQAAGFAEVVRIIREVEPLRPSHRLTALDTPATVAIARRVEPAGRLARLVRGDLDWVVMKALEKERAQRYETANAFARDVQRYLADESVEACPPSALYRVRRFVRRNRVSLAVATAFVSLLVAGVVVSARQAIQAEAARVRAVESQQALRKALTREVADRLERDLRQLAVVGDALAATVEVRADWGESELEWWMREMMTRENRIYGLTLAFEPDTFDPRPDLRPARLRLAPLPFDLHRHDPNRDGYSFYVWHKDSKPHPVAAPLELIYDYRKQTWYRETLAGRAGWSEPFMDMYAGDIPLVAYTRAIRLENGRPTGALTVDLSLEYFQRLAEWLRELNFGEGSYGFVMSREGRVISHPHLGLDQVVQKYGENRNVKLHDVWAAPEFKELVRGILAHTDDTVGQATCVDPATGRQSQFLFARFKPSGWVFVAVIPEDSR